MIISFFYFQIREIPIAMSAMAERMERDECFSSGSGPRTLSVSKGLKSQSVSPHSLLPRKPHAPFHHGGPIPQCVCVRVYSMYIQLYGYPLLGGPTSF